MVLSLKSAQIRMFTVVHICISLDFSTLDGWLVVLGFNFSFQSHRLLFSHASAEVRGEDLPERKVASTGDRTHNHQVMNPTPSPLSHPGWASSLEIRRLLKDTELIYLQLCDYLFVFMHHADAFTHCQTKPQFDAQKIYSCAKHGEKRRNCL